MVWLRPKFEGKSFSVNQNIVVRSVFLVLSRLINSTLLGKHGRYPVSCPVRLSSLPLTVEVWRRHPFPHCDSFLTRSRFSFLVCVYPYVLFLGTPVGPRRRDYSTSWISVCFGRDFRGAVFNLRSVGALFKVCPDVTQELAPIYGRGFGSSIFKSLWRHSNLVGPIFSPGDIKLSYRHCKPSIEKFFKCLERNCNKETRQLV